MHKMASYELTDEQINELFSFCKKHYVHHYDVQVELVDHLANAIEEKINANPNLSFEKALDEVYKTFGYKGFAGIVEAKTIAIEKQYRKLRYKLFFTYFTWPKAMFTLFIFACLLSLKSIVPIDYQNILVSTLFLSFLLFELFFVWKASRPFKKQHQKLLLTEVGKQKFFFSFLGIQIMIHSNRFFEKIEQINWYQYSLCCLLIVVMILFSLAYVELCKQLHAKAIKEYPIAFA